MTSVLAAPALKYIKAQTQLNDHGAAYQCAAKAIGRNDLAERFGSINRRQLQLGHLPHDLYNERHTLYQQLLAAARDLLSFSGYKQLYRVL